METLSVQKMTSKLTAGNSYLHHNSCHYPKWTQNIPKGQFCQLRQNCTRDTDYIKQSTILKRTFLDKQYPEALVDQAYEIYLKGKPLKPVRELEDHSTRFITTFHFQYKKMEKISENHWNILQKDLHLKTILPEHPRVTYRRAPNLRNKIAPSKFKPMLVSPNITILIPLVGMYQGHKALCKTCKFIQHGKKFFSTKDKTYQLKEFHNCSSDFVVYELTCPCGLIYVGRSIRALRQRFGEHRRLIEVGEEQHSVTR